MYTRLVHACTLRLGAGPRLDGMEFLGAPELLVVLVVALLVFGPTKLPKLARSLGEAAREFRRATTEADRDQPSGDMSSNGGATEPRGSHGVKGQQVPDGGS